MQACLFALTYIVRREVTSRRSPNWYYEQANEKAQTINWAVSCLTQFFFSRGELISFTKDKNAFSFRLRAEPEIHYWKRKMPKFPFRHFFSFLHFFSPSLPPSLPSLSQPLTARAASGQRSARAIVRRAQPAGCGRQTHVVGAKAGKVAAACELPRPKDQGRNTDVAQPNKCPMDSDSTRQQPFVLFFSCLSLLPPTAAHCLECRIPIFFVPLKKQFSSYRYMYLISSCFSRLIDFTTVPSKICPYTHVTSLTLLFSLRVKEVNPEVVCLKHEYQDGIKSTGT